jgi:hypothetical protein
VQPVAVLTRALSAARLCSAACLRQSVQIVGPNPTCVCCGGPATAAVAVSYVQLPPLPGRNYMYTVDYVDEISRDKLTPEGE